MPTIRGYKYKFLTAAGFYHKEALEFSRQYSMNQLRTIPYLQDLIRWRRLYRDSLRKRKYTELDIRRSVTYLYYKNNWVIDKTLDPWQMLKHFRKEAIATGDYHPVPKRKGSHHKEGISKGDVIAQRLRAKARGKGKRITGRVQDTLDKIAVLNQRINSTKDTERRNSLIAERNNLWQTIR